MDKIPFNRQRLRPSALQFLQGERSAGHELKGDDLRRAVEEWSGKELPSELRDLFAEFMAPAPKRPGRPDRPEDRAREDFTLQQIHRIYPWLLARCQKSPPGKDNEHMPPSERAYRYLVDSAPKVLKNIDWRSLRNKHTAWKHRRFQTLEHVIDSGDYDSAIEQQFPCPNRS